MLVVLHFCGNPHFTGHFGRRLFQVRASIRGRSLLLHRYVNTYFTKCDLEIKKKMLL